MLDAQERPVGYVESGYVRHGKAFGECKTCGNCSAWFKSVGMLVARLWGTSLTMEILSTFDLSRHPTGLNLFSVNR